ncbi:hypothetical protein [Tenacibaculum finnmarkense]|uniref:hypothetical protein n=1 Tax=Tenacibaculum finnmarkense TaxID=2781243 RepID=UPI001E477E13|nr:hypothetical protein [Tenacibaculum finnmarkense]MCD8409765.1 hypothetical protein [Tenacibaculum finnmarkense genomovar ulcerans]
MFYIVTGFLYRNENFKEEELIEINKEFRHENPEKARENAFKYAKSIIEVLLESINVPYQNEKQAEKALVNFHTSNIIEEHPKLSFVTYNNDIDKLITIAYSTSKKPNYITKSGIVFYDSYEVIYAFGYESELLKKRITKNLKIETEILIKVK